MMEKQGRRIKAAIAALAALAAAFAAVSIARSEQLNRANAQISAMYQKAFYETCELMEGISSNCRKLLVAGDQAQQQALIARISRDAQGVSSDLALLPVGQETISATIKFINQLEDFVDTLSQKAAEGTGISARDYATLSELSDSAAQFSLSIGGLLSRFENGQNAFDADSFAPEQADSLHPLSSVASDYPVLLYDGPFSDGETSGEYEYLSGMDEFTVQQAEESLKSYIDVDRAAYQGESHPEVDAYEFSVRSGDYTISAIVTKRGGQILYLMPENTFDEESVDTETLLNTARAFLISRGYGNMHMSYYSAFGGVLTVNFAAMEGDTILYPDLVKLQLSMRDGRVIGADAKGYLKNHRARAIGDIALNAQQAMERVGSRLTAESARLCVIPKNKKEYLCYEISATDGEDQFLSYIDARTGVERDLMRVLNEDNGRLVM